VIQHVEPNAIAATTHIPKQHSEGLGQQSDTRGGVHRKNAFRQNLAVIMRTLKQVATAVRAHNLTGASVQMGDIVVQVFNGGARAAFAQDAHGATRPRSWPLETEVVQPAADASPVHRLN
jgi:hypothetical protein